MQRRMTFGWFAGMIVLLATFACNAAAASQFTADMTMKEGSDTITGKIYVKDLKYRMDLVEDGHQIFVNVDQTAGMTRVLSPEEKMYIEMGTQDFRSLMKDPFQGIKYSASIGDSKHLGTETVNGYQCDKYLISINAQNAMTQWVSQKLEFPVRIIMDVSESKSVELQNIQEGPVDDALFEIPAGYTIMKTDEPTKEPPVQTTEVTKETPEVAKETSVQTPEVSKETPVQTLEVTKETPVQTPEVPKETPTQQGDKARIAVGEVKSQTGACSNDMAAAIGEMLSTALANNEKFIVLAGGSADLQVTGTVTKFEPEVKEGGGLGGLKKKALGKVGVEAKSAKIEMDVELIESSTGKVLKGRSIEGESSKWTADITAGDWVEDVELSGDMSIYSDEPMEKAVRAALAKAVEMISKEVPKDYYRYTGEEQPTGESAAAPAEGTTKPASGEVAGDMTLYTKYDFIPGDKVIFYDDMKDDEEGEFPYRWKLDNGVYEVVRLGKEFWIMASDNGSIRPKMPDAPLPPMYTVELEFYNNGPNYTGNYFYIYWVNAKGNNVGEFGISSQTSTWLSINGKSLAGKSLVNALTKGVHTMRIMATKSTIKCFIDQERVANVPKVDGFNPVGFRLHHRPYRDADNPTLFKGFRFAEGGKSMREQLDETGKIVTHGILFDVNSAKIKGESYKTLKNIGQLLSDDPALRLSIEGHTDSDGTDEHNATLSQNRANSVRDYLVSIYNIDAGRLEAKGWGESKPIDTNDTAEGKANNRRVELVKLQ